MSSRNTKAAPEPVAAVAQVEAPSEFPLSLEEFCKRLSASDRRVELIGAFHHVEKSAGRDRDTESAYSARFVAFVNQPA